MTEHVLVPITEKMVAAAEVELSNVLKEYHYVLDADGIRRVLTKALAAAPTPPSPQPVAPSEAATRVCHDDQMICWTGDIVGRLSMEGWLKDDLSYDDVIEIHSSVADEIKDIVKSAFAHPELEQPPTPPVSLDEIREVLGNIAEHPGPHADEAAHWRADEARALLSKLKEMGVQATVQDSGSVNDQECRG